MIINWDDSYNLATCYACKWKYADYRIVLIFSPIETTLFIFFAIEDIGGIWIISLISGVKLAVPIHCVPPWKFDFLHAWNSFCSFICPLLMSWLSLLLKAIYVLKIIVAGRAVSQENGSFFSSDQSYFNKWTQLCISTDPGKRITWAFLNIFQVRRSTSLHSHFWPPTWCVPSLFSWWKLLSSSRAQCCPGSF